MHERDQAHTAEHLLDQALELGHTEREAFLRRACGDDGALLERVSRLLRFAETSDGFLGRSPLRGAAAVAVEPSDQVAGTRIGAFRIVRPLGAGGMGEVFLAERVEGGFQQQVALKLLRAELCQSPERFHAEREILAGLHHAGIAQLLDGGVTPEGRPYMAMEYVEGEDLGGWCRTRGADLDLRLDLFLQVCDAVSYAHEHLVVHRDLKPSNVLVTPAGQVKLLDFGIAKLLRPTVADDATRTAHLSPDYAAPEQLAGGAITTATDVHALGVILFELLAGRRPWQVSELPLALAVQRLMGDAAPRLVAPGDKEGPVPAKRLRGDLEAIVAKALRKEPQARYRDARALADDVVRHRRHQPVLAREGARSYVMRRALRRHWLPLTAAAAVFVALFAGVTVAAWQAQRARSEAERATATKDFLISMFRASDPRVASDRPRAEITAKELLDLGSARIDTEFAAQPELQIELLGLTADIYEELADDARFAELQSRRIALARTHYGASHPIVIDGLLTQAEAMSYRQDYAGATRLLAEIDGLIRAQGLDRSLARAEWWRVTARNLFAKAAGGTKEMEVALAEAARLYEELAPNSTPYAGVLNLIARQHTYRGEHAEARRFVERAIAVAEAAPERDDALISGYYFNLARKLEKLGEADAALAAYKRAVELARATYGAHHATYWVIRATQGRLLHMLGERDAARELFATLNVEITPGWTATNGDHWARGLYAGCLAAEGRLAESLPILEATHRSYQERDVGGDLHLWQRLLGDAYDRVGRTADARPLLEAALAGTLAGGRADPQWIATARERWARFLLDHPDAADPRFEAAKAAFNDVISGMATQSTVEVALAHAGLARIAGATGDAHGAARESEAALQVLARITELYDRRVEPQIWLVRSAVLLGDGDRAGAREWAGKALAASRRYDDPASPAIAAATAALAAASP